MGDQVTRTDYLISCVLRQSAGWPDVDLAGVVELDSMDQGMTSLAVHGLRPRLG